MDLVYAWIAARGVDKGGGLAALDLVPVRAGSRRAPFGLTHWPGGWTVIFSQHDDFPTHDRMAAVSVGGTAIVCAVDEQAMASAARGYEDGQAVWAVEHAGPFRGASPMRVDGVPPPQWRPIFRRMAERQAREDAGDAQVDLMHGAPIELAFTLCGFSEDRPLSDGLGPFTPLAPRWRCGLLGKPRRLNV